MDYLVRDGYSGSFCATDLGVVCATDFGSNDASEKSGTIKPK